MLDLKDIIISNIYVTVKEKQSTIVQMTSKPPQDLKLSVCGTGD